MNDLNEFFDIHQVESLTGLEERDARNALKIKVFNERKKVREQNQLNGDAVNNFRSAQRLSSKRPLRPRPNGCKTRYDEQLSNENDVSQGGGTDASDYNGIDQCDDSMDIDATNNTDDIGMADANNSDANSDIACTTEDISSTTAISQANTFLSNNTYSDLTNGACADDSGYTEHQALSDSGIVINSEGV